MWLDINYIQTDNISELIFTKYAFFHAKHIVIAKCKAPGPMAVINIIK